MVAPVLLGASASASASGDHTLSDMKIGDLSIPQTALAVTVHVGAMLLVMGVISVLVYERLGVAILRKAWVNLDLLWAAAFVIAGVMTFFS
jgi:hypothetical protein